MCARECACVSCGAVKNACVWHCTTCDGCALLHCRCGGFGCPTLAALLCQLPFFFNIYVCVCVCVCVCTMVCHCCLRAVCCRCDAPVFWLKAQTVRAGQNLAFSAGIPVVSRFADTRVAVAIIGPGLPSEQPHTCARLLTHMHANCKPAAHGNHVVSASRPSHADTLPHLLRLVWQTARTWTPLALARAYTPRTDNTAYNE